MGSRGIGQHHRYSIYLLYHSIYLLYYSIYLLYSPLERRAPTCLCLLLFKALSFFLKKKTPPLSRPRLLPRSRRSLKRRKVSVLPLLRRFFSTRTRLMSKRLVPLVSVLPLL
jgi:hypothetical protein